MDKKNFIEIDLIEGLKKLDKEGDTFSTSRDLWYKLLRLLITLSSSFLLITIALAKDIFNLSVSTLPIFLALAWIGYFFTIIFGIFAEIDEVIFLSSNAKSKEDLKIKIVEKISMNKNSAKIYIDKVYIENSFIFAAVAINLFIISTVLLCFSFLKDFVSNCASYFYIGILIFSLLVINKYFLDKRGKYRKYELIDIDN